MNKKIVNLVLVLAISGGTYALIASGKKKSSPKKSMVISPPAASSSSSGGGSGNPVASPVAASSSPSKSGSQSAVDTSANLQLEMAKIMQKVTMQLEQLDQLEVAQAVQAALQESIASKDFDKGVDEIRDGLQKLAKTVAGNLQVCTKMKAKLSKIVDEVLADFTKVVRSKKFGQLTGDSYISQIMTAVLKGVQSGLKVSKSSPGKCPIHSGDLSKLMTNMGNGKTPGGPVPPPPSASKPSATQEAALQAFAEKS